MITETFKQTIGSRGRRIRSIPEEHEPWVADALAAADAGGGYLNREVVVVRTDGSTVSYTRQGDD
jgi:hypothetical protein